MKANRLSKSLLLILAPEEKDIPFKDIVATRGFPQSYKKGFFRLSNPLNLLGVPFDLDCEVKYDIDTKYFRTLKRLLEASVIINKFYKRYGQDNSFGFLKKG